MILICVYNSYKRAAVGTGLQLKRSPSFFEFFGNPPLMKMKLALVVAATLAALSANAADVNIYGSISTGIVVTHTRGTAENSHKSTTNVAMESAWAGDSVWGITAAENLGNGWNVGVALESEYDSSTGAMATENTLFDSMSYLWVGNDTVKFSIGNLGGAITSGGGDFDMAAAFDPLEAAYGLGGMGLFSTKDLAPDSALALEITPAEGLKIGLQASMGDNKITKWSERDHYYGFGVSYENGPFAVMGSAETVRNAATSAMPKLNSYYLTAGLSWDAGVIKPMVLYQYGNKVSLRSFADGALEGAFSNEEDDAPGKVQSFLLGATAPVAGGTLAVSGQYAHVKFRDTNAKGRAYTVGVSYTYEFSKRTSLYAGAVYVKGKKVFADYDGFNQFQAGLGINHTF